MTLSINEATRRHRASIVSLSLTEILILMVFSVMTFNLMSMEKGEQPSSELEKLLDVTKQALAESQEKLAKAIAERDEQHKKAEQTKKLLQSKERLLQRLLVGQDGTLSVAQKEIFPKLQEHIRDLEKQVVNERRMIVDKQQQIRRLLAEGKGKTGYPICSVTTGFLLKIELNDDGTLLVLPAWSAGAENDAMGLPGVTELVSKKNVSLEEFSKQAGLVYRWGAEQTIPCRFKATTIRKTQGLATYLTQIKTIERYFYAKKDY